MTDLLLCYYGDDFTGSTDALEALARAGAKTMLFLAPPTREQLDRFGDLNAVGVAGMTRMMTPEQMEQELAPALKALKRLGARYVHYKICSTFDSSPTLGSIGRAIDVGAEVFPAPFVPLAAGAPGLGRHCVFGNLFARMGAGSDGEVLRLDRHPAMANHPVTPANESDLRRQLAEQTAKRVALFDVLQFALPDAGRKRSLRRLIDEGAEVILFDVLYDDHLHVIGELMAEASTDGQPLFAVGSSAVETALGAYWKAHHVLTPVAAWDAPGPAQPLLVASGSCCPVTWGQIDRAVAGGFAEVALDTERIARAADVEGAAAEAADEAARHLAAGRHAIVHTSRGREDVRMQATIGALRQRGDTAIEAKGSAARLLGTALGRVIRSALEGAEVRRICLAGGDTASHAARALGVEALEMIAPMSPGAPLCRVHGTNSPVDGLEMNFKGGQVGDKEYFTSLASGIYGGAL